ncbi:unnamed protein product [Mytilus coruscus]|uniref:Macro domain-containing protein n=1 Tax=Mytilus coruscus TaxID=42192 RepID=A0A6J8CGQ7_MYTCO|nr:unnamed protein product [Mytilus coruscus]
MQCCHPSFRVGPSLIVTTLLTKKSANDFDSSTSEDELVKGNLFSSEVHTNADKTNKLTINFEDRIRELEGKLKETEKENTSKLQTGNKHYNVEKAVDDIKEWKGHILRSRNQEEARRNTLEIIKEKKDVMITIDWAMKFLPRKFREGQTDWFAKRGINWHISVSLMKGSSDTYQSITHVHLFSSTVAHDSSVTSSIISDVVQDLIQMNHGLSNVHLFSDNAGCYKRPCDRRASHLKSIIKRYVNEGNDVVTAEQMKKAIDLKKNFNYRVKVVTPVIDLDPVQNSIKSIPGISQLHNFKFEDSCLRVWKAYGIGTRKLIPWTDICQDMHVSQLKTVQNWLEKSCNVFSSDDMTEEEEVEECEPPAKKAKYKENIYSCPKEGNCNYQLEKQSLIDRSKSEYSVKLDKLFPKSVNISCSTTSAKANTAKIGWALKLKKKKTNFAVEQKQFMQEQFHVGKHTGRMVDPFEAAKLMMVEIKNGERRFKKSEYLTGSQISGKGHQYTLTGFNTVNESDNQLTESDLNKSGAVRFSRLSTESDKLKTLKLKQLHFGVLQNLDFISFLNKKVPTCNAKMNENAITFIGTQREVEKQMKFFFDYYIDIECIKHVQGKPRQIPERMLEFVQRENIREYINKKLEIEDIRCYWYSDKDEGYIKLFTWKGKGSKAVAVVQQCLDWEKFTRSPAFDVILKEKSMETFFDDQKSNLMFDIYEKDLVVVGLESSVRNFVELNNKICEANTKIEHRFPLNQHKEITALSSNILQHLRKFHPKEIEKFERKWNVTFKEENEAVLLEGESSDIQRASDSLKDSSVIEQKWSCHVDNPVDVIKDLSSKSIPKLQLVQWVSQTKDQRIIFVHGSVTDMAADIIVYPVTKSEGQPRLGKIGKAIVTEGGFVMQREVKEMSRLEEIVITSATGNLPCLMVAYFPVPFFKPGVQLQKDMVKRIQDLLTEVAKTQLQSVVITTDIGNDIPEPTFLHWFLDAYKAHQHKLYCLNQIYLCTESENISPLLNVLKDGISNLLTMFDFTAMFQQRSSGVSVTRKPADISITLVNGKLVDQKVDILVNSSNRNLELEKGAVSASILEAGGERIYTECKHFYPNGINYGQVITTNPGNLRCKAICHGCLSHWKPIADISCQILAKLMFGCLLHADSCHSESIAFPVFGTGNLMYPWGEVAKTMIRTVFKYGRMFPDTTMKKVRIVFHGNDYNLIEVSDPTFKEQATLIRNCVDCTQDMRYLQILKIMMTNKDEFDKILTETIHRQEQERRSIHYKVSDWCSKFALQYCSKVTFKLQRKLAF